MVLLAVQRSGRTVMRATTRSLSASTKVTPFKSAKGIFIERTFSSGVMDTPGFLQAISQSAGWNVRVNDAMTSEVIIVRPRYADAMQHFPPHRIVCLTEETVETLYLLGEQDRIVGVSGYAVRPP